MAIFNMSEIGNVNFDSKDDIKQIKSHLFMLNDQLRYMFNNLNPEDNYSDKALVKYIENNEKIAEIDISVNHIKLAMVNKGNIISTINLSEEGVAIKGDKIKLEGTVTANNYFRINTDGSMHCTNANINGTLTGSNINASNIIGSNINATTIKGSDIEGSTIRGGNIIGANITGGSIKGEVELQCGHSFWAKDVGDNRAYEVGFGAFYAYYDGGIGKDVFSDHMSNLRLINGGDIHCKDIYFPEDSWTDGWSLLRMLKDLYNKYTI